MSISLLSSSALLIKRPIFGLITVSNVNKALFKATSKYALRRFLKILQLSQQRVQIYTLAFQSENKISLFEVVVFKILIWLTPAHRCS